MGDRLRPLTKVPGLPPLWSPVGFIVPTRAGRDSGHAGTVGVHGVDLEVRPKVALAAREGDLATIGRPRGLPVVSCGVRESCNARAVSVHHEDLGIGVAVAPAHERDLFPVWRHGWIVVI